MKCMALFPPDDDVRFPSQVVDGGNGGWIGADRMAAAGGALLRG